MLWPLCFSTPLTSLGSLPSVAAVRADPSARLLTRLKSYKHPHHEVINQPKYVHFLLNTDAQNGLKTAEP